MGTSSDPVRLGLVRSLARPGGNTTGVSTQLIDLSAKRLELLREAVPRLRQVAILSNPANATTIREARKETELAARHLGVGVQSFEVVKDPTALEGVFGAIVRAKPDALIVIPDPLVLLHISRIVEFTTRNR
jgi:putative ABC transport system substrate-binding protein